MKKCCRSRRGSSPRPPGLQSDAHPTEPPNMPSNSMQNQSNYHQQFNEEDLNQRQGIRSTPYYKSDQMAQSYNTQSSYPKKVREKSRECHNHKPQPFPDPKRKTKPTNLNKHKPNKRTKSTKISTNIESNCRST